QAHLENKNIAAARTVYQTALQAGVNAPLVWVGMGHVELLEGKKNEARQRFEAAITNSKNKNKDNPAILAAIGRANADAPSTLGDPMYAIELLRRAATLDPKNPEVPALIGLNYRRLTDRGGEAYEAFENALRIDPKYARANFYLAKIFLSQNNVAEFEKYYNRAIESDPKFAPAYLDLYNYYALRDVNRARGYLDKFVENTDRDCAVEFFSAEYLFRAGKYQESLDRARAMENGACKTYARLPVLYAYNYERLGDSVQARTNIERYLSTAKAENVQPTDYVFAGQLLARFRGSEAQAGQYLERAIAADTTVANKITYMNTASEMYGRAGLYNEQLNWLRRLAVTKRELSNRDFYVFSDAAIRANQLQTADSITRAYIQKFPDQEYGYSLRVRAAKAADPDSTTGTAFPAIDEYITFLAKDTAKNKAKILNQYYYMATVTADKMKDYPRAIGVLERILAVDPQNAFANNALPILRKAGTRPAPATKPVPKTTPAKPATKTTATKTTSTKTTTKK
ncbi:MAG TPA: tetratricopeptide repeat protein, partial [Segetibacter sp.]